MHLHALASLALLPAFAAAATAKPNKDAILLSKVQSLTLRNGKQTTHRRVPAVPQLTCEANPPALCDLYTIDTLRCTNQGTAYDDQDIQWSCTASLPPELKLGSADVICEGYASPDDPYILKGSCAVVYSLLLTDYGEQKYPDLYRLETAGRSSSFWNWGRWSTYLFWAAFVAVVLWIVRGAQVADRPQRRWGGGGGWGGGWGGGGGGGGGDDPPPPYPGTKPPSATQGWQPGFWSGLAGGAAAGYMAGRNNDRNDNRNYAGRGLFGGGSSGGFQQPPRPSGSPARQPLSSARHESTGFGSTRRR